MSRQYAGLIIIALTFAFPAFANKKARVITESGKKWDVIFLKMSNDTIYLKARKTNGSFFSISGHKSKFRKVEFNDGSLLDLSLSEFPSAESKGKSKEFTSNIPSRDTVFLTAPVIPQYQKDSIYLANKAICEQISGTNGPSSPSTVQGMKDTSADISWGTDSSELKRSLDMAAEYVTNDTEGVVSLETNPSNAIVEIDNKPVEGTTPLIAKHLKIGEHVITASKDLLRATKKITLLNGTMEHMQLTLEKPKTAPVPAVKKKGRRWAPALGVLSMASFAGSAGTYYLYHRDHPNEVKTFETLNNSLVKGSNTEALIAQNKTQHDKAQMRLDLSQIFLGAGVALLATGIIIYF